MLSDPNLLDPSDPDPATPADYAIPGFRIQSYDFAAQWLLVIRVAEKQAGWVVHSEDIYSLESTQMATTIRYREELFRIDEAEETPSGWVYRLTLWPPNEVIARVVELTPEAIAQERKERENLRRDARLSTPSFFYEFVFGFLPARVQNQMAERIFFSPADASRKSGLVQFFVFFMLAAFSLIGAVAAMYAFSESAGDFLANSFIFFVLAVEGGVRWGHAASADRPLGFTPLELLDRLFHRQEYNTRRKGE